MLRLQLPAEMMGTVPSTASVNRGNSFLPILKKGDLHTFGTIYGVFNIRGGRL
jgi:hypothetical protein